MDQLKLHVNDLRLHVVMFGLDVFPPVELEKERTRLQILFDETKERWPHLFDLLVSGSNEFRVSSNFRRNPNLQGPSMPIDTFTLTPRGPVFAFPILLPAPIGETGLDRTYLEVFRELRQLFAARVPQHNVHRVGLVRDLLFETSSLSCNRMLTHAQKFCGARLEGGQAILAYRDAKYNHQFVIEPIRVARSTRHPIIMATTEDAGYGVKIRFDVNNTFIERPLQESDIEEVIDRATTLWPENMLELINGLPRSV